MLSYTEFGESHTNTPPLVIAHGLFGSGRNWGVIAKRLSDTRRVITPDMRNHGQSPRKDTQTYPDMAQDLAELIQHIGGPVDLLGHSMGGKASMVMALQHPQLLRRLIVADIAPVPYAHTQSHQIDAMKAVDLNAVTRRSEAAEQLGQQGVEPALQSFFTQSLDVAGKQWRLNLDVLDAQMPHIIGFPEVSGTFENPTLFLTGADSDYVTPQDRPRIKSLFPAAKFAKIPQSGHWLHADRPREFEAAVRTYLDS
ncbi:alpha/beta fold hydrolase [Sulfitobacter donghicola]|uniref:Esterase n=1 Tax=Sulfitobacter donghicola DSW-25 = KCTC 12864 = JCM 14565 TaxID=1300350 RepID=A0A073IH69_9RHOB|nr:alpha/beta fold hydrolase [Sulfitobacter donghicola]KEJ88861.1 esterase [Sulfitobacter donghicola DSW-25 = KCTC 12864 = JCM 14565]KIN68662.1 Hydrolase, alpha/beta fold family protein [Sulfitobacter donghicola DSW-25 = KCTC 12864 = JCM 14565]